MTPSRLLAQLFLVLMLSSNALANPPDGAATIGFGTRNAPGVIARAGSFEPLAGVASIPNSSSSSPNGGGRPSYRFLPLTCVSAAEGSGDVVVSLDQNACLSSSPDDEVAEAPDRLPSAYELAWVAADRAMSVAEWPELQTVPGRRGLTGLRSFFWLDAAPRPVTASASVPGLVVTAEAHPIRYGWDFGEGRRRTTSHTGRPWTKRRNGNIGHLYERRGTYRIEVEVVWQARWRIGAGAWQHLGYFSNGDSRDYRVRQMVAMLSRRP